MRKLFLILFMAMLPLQWTAAAVASLCLPSAQATGSAPVHVHVQADEAHHAHDPILASASEQGSHHHGAHDYSPDSKALHADPGGCCHAAASTLPTPPTIGRIQAAPGDLVARITVLAVSHSSKSPFRPPRLALA